METFGILDFLKPLLAFTQSTSPSRDSAKDSTFEDPSQNQTPTANEPSLKQDAVLSAECEQNRAQTAYLTFMQAHEQRAKRIKK